MTPSSKLVPDGDWTVTSSSVTSKKAIRSGATMAAAVEAHGKPGTKRQACLSEAIPFYLTRAIEVELGDLEVVIAGANGALLERRQSMARALDAGSGIHFWDQFDALPLEQRIVRAKSRGHFSHDAHGCLELDDDVIITAGCILLRYFLNELEDAPE